MNTVSYQALNQTVHHTLLHNGLSVYVMPMPGFSKSHACFATHYGGVDLNFAAGGTHHATPAGVAHYLEHKMFDMPDGENIMETFAKQGALPNAYTSVDVTNYHFECTERFDDNLRTLLRYVSTPHFTDESADKERGIIEQEIRMVEDSPARMIFYNMLTGLYRHHHIRIPIAGTVESIAGINADILNLCYQTFYSPGQMVLCAAGEIDPQAVFAIAEEMIPARKIGAVARDYGPEDHDRADQAVYAKQMEVSLPLFMAGFKISPPDKGAAAFRAELLNELACETLTGKSSPLYAELYNRGLVNNQYEYGYFGFSGGACLIAGGESRDPAAVCDALWQAAADAGSTLDRALFERLKKAAFGSQLQQLDDPDAICRAVMRAHFQGYDHFTFPEVFNSLTFEDAIDALTRGMSQQRTTLSRIDPAG